MSHAVILIVCVAAFGQGVVFPGFSVIFGQIFKQWVYLQIVPGYSSKIITYLSFCTDSPETRVTSKPMLLSLPIVLWVSIQPAYEFWITIRKFNKNVPLGLGCYTTVCTFIYVSCFTLAGENVCKTLRAKLFESIMHKVINQVIT